MCTFYTVVGLDVTLHKRLMTIITIRNSLVNCAVLTHTHTQCYCIRDSHALFYTIAAWRSVTSFSSLSGLLTRTKGANTFTQDNDFATHTHIHLDKSVTFGYVTHWYSRHVFVVLFFRHICRQELRLFMLIHVKITIDAYHALDSPNARKMWTI